MPGTWSGDDLEARALPAQMTDVIHIDPGDFEEPLPEHGQRPKMTNAEAQELFHTAPLGTTPTITKAVLGSTIGVNPLFVSSFGKPSLLQSWIATTIIMPINPAYIATPHCTGATWPFIAVGHGGAGMGGSGRGGSRDSRGSILGSSSGVGFPGGGSDGRGPGGSVGGGAQQGGGNHSGNGGLKGTMPTIFEENHAKSDQFMREFRILMLSNRNHHSLAIPLNRIGVALSCIHGLKVDNWVEYMLNKVEQALRQGVQPEHEVLWEMFRCDFSLSFTDITKVQNVY